MALNDPFEITLRAHLCLFGPQGLIAQTEQVNFVISKDNNTVVEVKVDFEPEKKAVVREFALNSKLFPRCNHSSRQLLQILVNLCSLEAAMPRPEFGG